MTVLQAAILGAVQGATEFLPVSSSAHLVILPALFGWAQPSLTFDVLLHAGTLVAVVVYFAPDIGRLLADAAGEITRRKLGPSGRLLGLLAAATIPAAVIGFAFADFFEKLFANPLAAGGFLLVTAALLVAADRFGSNSRDLGSLRLPGSLLVGAAQAAAIAPGISRSGATISAGMFLGLRREEAARFSFLMSVPIIAGSFVSKIGELAAGNLTRPAAVVGFAAAAVVGYACIAFLIRYLANHRLRIFAVYCAAAGAFTIAAFLLKS